MREASMADRIAMENALIDFYDARGNRDLEKAMSFVHPDCCFRIVGTESLGPFTHAVRTAPMINEAAAVLFQMWDLKGMRTVNAYFDGDVALVHRAGRVTHLPTGASFESEFMDKFTFEDGKVVEYLQFVDTYQIAKVAGFGAA
jgi:ketosteroid isomerase-like protein